MISNNIDYMFNGRTWKVRITFIDANKTYTESEIISFNIITSQDTSKIIGGTQSKQLDIELLDTVDANLEGLVKVELGLLQNNGSYIYQSLGERYKVDKIEQNNGKIKITAFDQFIWLIGTGLYEEGGNSTEIKLQDLVAHIENKFNITLDFSDVTLKDYTIINPYKEKYRDIISYLAICTSSNTFFKHDSDTIKFVPLVPKQTADLTLDGHTYYSLTVDRAEFSVERIELNMGTFGFKHGEATNSDGIITLKLPFATQLIADDIYENLKGYYQEGFNCKFMGNPCLEPFDTIQLTDINGGVYKVQLNGYKMIFNGGFVVETNTQIMKASSTTTHYVENTLRTRIEVMADKILQTVEAEYQKKDNVIVAKSSKENIIVVLDEDLTPSKTTEYDITFTVNKNNTTEEIPCVIKNVTLSDDNLTAEYSNTSPVLTLKANTDRVFTAEEGWMDVVIETTEGDCYKRLFWSTTINTIENSLVVLSAPTQIFTRDNALAEWKPNSITITASTNRCEVIGYSYSIDNGNSFTEVVSGSNGLVINGNNITISNDSELFNSTKNVIIKVNTDVDVTDTITISQVEDTDMIYVLLSNENHTFVASSDGKAIPTSIDIEVMGYKGNDEAPVTIGSISNIPTGMSVSISGNIITISVDNTFTKLNGTLTIPITCEGISFKKTFSYSLSVSGGRGVSTVDNYYLASSLKKGVTVDTKGWSLKVPELTLELPYLWNYEVTTFTDNSITTTDPALIGTYAEDGRGIVSVVEYYLITSKKTGITISNSGWSTTIPTITTENRYLWNYEKITYSDDTVETTEPCIIGAYGDKGTSASWVTIEATNQVFKMSKNSNKYSPLSIKLTPIFNNSEYIKWQYSNDSGETWKDVNSKVGGLSIDSDNVLTVNSINDIFLVDSVQFKVLGTNDAFDILTITRIQDGKDNFNVILDNENHTFTANYEGYAMAQSITINPTGYFGNEKVSITISNITGLPTGMTANISNNRTKTPTITINVDTTMTSRNGTITIPIGTTYNGKSYSLNKQFSYALSLDGTPASSCKIVASSNVFLSGDGGTTYSPNILTFTGTFTQCAFNKWQYLDTVVGAWKNVSSGNNGFTLTNQTLKLAVTSSLFNERGGTVNIRLLSDKSGVYDTITVSKLTQIDDISKDLENIRSEITQTNYNWKASFSLSNTTNMLFDGDFDKPISKCNWAVLNANSTMDYGVVNAYPFIENHTNLSTRFNSNSECGIQYSLDLELKANTDYVYQAYIYVKDDSLITTSESLPLSFWTWTGDNPSNMNSTTSEIVDYSQILYSGRYNLVYVHFKTKDLQDESIKCRLFIKGKTNSSMSVLYIRQVCMRERNTVAPYCGNSNEVIAGVTTIDMNGITVEHTLCNTRTEMTANGFYVIGKDNNQEDITVAELGSKEAWSQLKVDKVFANNIENIYEGDANLYVDHSATVAGDGSADKPFNSFARLKEHLEANPVINKDLFITIRDPGFVINEQLRLERLKGTGFIKITLEGNLIIANAGNGQWCMRFHQIPKWVWIVGSREFGSATTGAVLCDGTADNGHGIYATDVNRLEVDAITIACKNWGIYSERTYLYTWHVDFGKTWCAVELAYQSIYYSSDDVGSCTDFCRLRSGSFAYWGCGAVRPQGLVIGYNGMYYDGGESLTPTASPRYPTSTPTPPAPSEQLYTYTYNWTSHQTYQYRWSNWGDSDCKQGSWGNLSPYVKKLA